MALTKKPCPGCGEVHKYRKPDEVCYECETKIKEHGRLTQQVAELVQAGATKKLFEYEVPIEGWLPGFCDYEAPPKTRDKQRGESQQILHRIISALGHPVFEGIERPSEGQHLPRYESHSWWVPIGLTEDNAKLIKDLFAFLGKLAGMYSEAGKREGQNILLALASGEMSVKDFNEATLDKRRRV